MAILNVTPDSFSDGGKFLDPHAALDRALEYVAEGAAFLDIGAESSRPGSAEVPAAEQLRRILPVLKLFRAKNALPVSIDTRSAKVAAACLDEGATLINDISALRHDHALPELLARSTCGVVLMHMQGTPKTMQKAPVYKNVVADIFSFFEERLRFCADVGIDASRLYIDPGIGFGKTIEHNLALLNRLRDFKRLRRPLVIGVSRKSFIGTLTGERDPERRVLGSVAVGLMAVGRGAAILRVHDVAAHAAALKIHHAIQSGMP